MTVRFGALHGLCNGVGSSEEGLCWDAYAACYPCWATAGKKVVGSW